MIFSTDGLAIVAIIHNVECYEGNLNLWTQIEQLRRLLL
jgi:hypothetical protein